MDGITQEISPVQVVNVNAVSIEPPHWPRVNHGEPKTAVLKASRPAGEFGTVHVKRVATAKTGTETVVRNTRLVGRRLCSAGPLLVLGALRLLYWPSLLLVLGLLRWLYWPSLLLVLGLLRWLYWPSLLLVLGLLWLLYWPGLLLVLGLLRLLYWPCLLLVLGLLRLLCRPRLLLLSALRLLCRVRLLLALCRPSLLLLFLLWLLLLLALALRVDGSNCSQKQEQDCRGPNFNSFHKCCLDSNSIRGSATRSPCRLADQNSVGLALRKAGTRLEDRNAQTGWGAVQRQKPGDVIWSCDRL
jgi:hypothetical protein